MELGGPKLDFARRPNVLRYATARWESVPTHYVHISKLLIEIGNNGTAFSDLVSNDVLRSIPVETLMPKMSTSSRGIAANHLLNGFLRSGLRHRYVKDDESIGAEKEYDAYAAPQQQELMWPCIVIHKNEVWANGTSEQTHMGKKYLLTIAIPGYRPSIENVELSSPVQHTTSPSKNSGNHSNGVFP
ncbi:hypothetical protein TNCV_5126121 [Trichonephila clavipes]|nr:hypothetical protein TNCV_5126121 [Trichonephila clavipes]